jgi:hypothetical protein
MVTRCADFPAGVGAPAQYGPRIRDPSERIGERDDPMRHAAVRSVDP